MSGSGKAKRHAKYSPAYRNAGPSANTGAEANEDDEDGDGAILDAPRPPVTKAIDVWALGVTLYCLLFASCPWTGVNEFVLFQAIHAREFEVPPTMGADRVVTGGRRFGRELDARGADVEGEGEGEGAVVTYET